MVTSPEGTPDGCRDASDMVGIVRRRHWQRPLPHHSLIHAFMHSFTAVSWGRLFTDRCEDRLGDVVSRAFDDSYFFVMCKCGMCVFSGV